jgi:pimeloyl-ACP methyl ester carboxylesterase
VVAPTEIRIDVRGESLRALTWPGGEPLVLLVHATGFCADVWGPAWDAARAAGASSLRAVAVDQRGHGGSSAPDAPAAYAWPQLAADVLACIDALNASRAVLVGHSSGATACLAAAGLRPERVAALALVEPVLFEPLRAGADADSFAGSRALAERARRRRAEFPSRMLAREHLAARFPFSGFAKPVLEAYLAGGLAETRDGCVELRCRPEVEAWAYEGAVRLDVWPCVERVACPVLLLAAEHSAMPAPLLARLERSVAGARAQRVAGATHFAPLERPNEVGARVGRFVAQLAAG